MLAQIFINGHNQWDTHGHRDNECDERERTAGGHIDNGVQQFGYKDDGNTFNGNVCAHDVKAIGATPCHSFAEKADGLDCADKGR